MAILSTHTGAKRSEYNKMKSVLDSAIPSDRIITIPNITIAYNNSGIFTIENSDIRKYNDIINRKRLYQTFGRKYL